MYSFDIFDTLITRCTASPKGIFMLMQEKIRQTGGYDSYLFENFCALRTGAEELARIHAAKSHGKQEITLDDIYRALATTACITDRQQEQLKELEVNTECSSVFGIQKNIALLKDLRNRHEKVVLISDMYLGEKNIRSILCQVDPVFADLPLYVSSDYGKTKGSGGLYKLVQSIENADFSDWVHYGDNEKADIQSALKLGIKAIHLPPEEVKEYEQPQKDVYHQISVGVSRYVRGLGEESAACETGCSLAGPLLYPYVRWMLNESAKRGINRLYFVARDGWILKRIADRIIRSEMPGIQTHYIYGSRKVWRLPAYEGSVEDFDRLLKWSNLDEVLCVRDLAEVFQLSVEELCSFLPKGYGKNIGEQQLSGFQRDNICRQLRENEAFRNYIIESQMEKRKLVIRYLQQEIDFSDDRYAFVELSGTGLTQKCLAQIIRNFYTGEIKNFYFKLDSIQEEGQCRFINFYPSNMKRSYMLELLCRAPHGQTEGYREEAGKIVPVLEQEEGRRIQEYHMEEYQNAVTAYTEHMQYAFIRNDLQNAVKMDIAGEYMEVIAVNPPERVAEYFRHMPFSSGGRKKCVVEFAPCITKKQLRKIYFWHRGENFREIYRGNSLDYALAISDRSEKYKEKCQKFRDMKAGRWLAEWSRYLRTHQKPGTDYFCPWELLKGNIVIYGAGRVGQAYVKQAGQRYAQCQSLLWVDSSYDRLQGSRMDVKSPEEVRNHSFDRILIAVHNDKARLEIWDRLREMGVEAGKIYYG